jgi:hypothetical protein
MTPVPEPPKRDRLNVARDITGLICFVVGIVGVGVILYGIAPVAAVLYGFSVLTVAGVMLASGVGR